jgi:hypothetical protein
VFLVVFFLYSTTGCASLSKPDDETICKKIAVCLEDGKTTREELLISSNLYRLDKMYKSKNNKIWIFRSYRSSNLGGIGIVDLVLIFNDEDVLKKHSLVNLR